MTNFAEVVEDHSSESNIVSDNANLDIRDSIGGKKTRENPARSKKEVNVTRMKK
jgi:hypothetical protein